MARDESLAGKVALITGGCRGIGRATAWHIAASGGHALVAARSEGELEMVVEEITQRGGSASQHPLDLTSRASIESLVHHIREVHGGLDILVNNAGVGKFGKVAAMEDDEWDLQLATNVTGVFQLSKRCWGLMKGRDATIINISSLAGDSPFAGGGAYCASKAALDALGQSMMLEGREVGIRVVTIAPGSVDTTFSSGQGSDWKLQPDDVAEAIMYVLKARSQCLPGRIELRTSQPRK